MSISSLQSLTAPLTTPVASSEARKILPLPTQATEQSDSVQFSGQYTPSKGETVLDDPSPLNFNVPVNSQTASSLIQGLKDIARMKEQTGGSVKLLLNTPGGDAHAGMQAGHFLKNLKVPVDTIVMGGQAASMGSLLFLMGTGRRVMTTDATLMIHQPRMMLNTQVTATEMENMGENAMRLKTSMDKVIAKVTDLPLKDVSKMTESDTFLYPLESLKKGFATHILMEDDLTQALSQDSIKHMSDEEITRRDREHDYDGLKTEDFDPQNVDRQKMAQRQATQQGRGRGLQGLPAGLEGLFGGGQGPQGAVDTQDATDPKHPRFVLMA